MRRARNNNNKSLFYVIPPRACTAYIGISYLTISVPVDVIIRLFSAKPLPELLLIICQLDT